jgi:polyisoprenoid-binding protein YceI
MRRKIMSYQIDHAHSQIQFTVRHMMISKVRGWFEKFDGTVQLDEQTPANSSVDIKIEAASINTREPQRDAHLRSADFLDAENHPYLTFKSKRVEVLDQMHAKLHGDMTIRGVTRPVVLDVEFNGQAKSPWGTTSFGFNGHTVINRKDWGLEWNKTLETGGWLVGDEITVDIELELVKVPEEVKEQAAS